MGKALTTALLLLPGALTLYLAFSSGGYFPGATSLVALVLALCLLLRAILAKDPLGGLSGPVAIAAAGLMLFALWVLISAQWSDSSARALIEFNRVLLYVVALLLFGSIRHTPAGLQRMVWGLAAAVVAVCAAGLLTRLYPDVFTIEPATQAERLSYPIGYWNALGLLAALGAVLCFHLTSSAREPAAARALGAAALPVLAATLLFTFSRGALVAACFGIVAYLGLGRPRLLPAGLLAAAPAVTLALIGAYRADLLASKQPTSAAAAAQGHDVALVLLICVLLAAGVRLALLGLDRRLEDGRLGLAISRKLGAGALALACAAVLIGLVAADLPSRIEAQVDRFTSSDVVQTGDYRDRLTDPGINRLDHWKVSLDGFSDAPLHGQGAGTFSLLWDLGRETDSDSEEGHSLYLEVMGELGVVGIGLLAVLLLALLAGVVRRTRGPHRSLYAAVLATALAWMAHASLDWDWEIAAVTLWLFALAGQAGAGAPVWTPAGERERDDSRGPRPLARGAMAVGCLALAATPAVVAASQARLSESIRAYGEGDCAPASEKARASLDILGNRPEPFEVIGYCDARSGHTRSAERAMREAVERDPRNWEYQYGLALVRASGGRDPRAAARRALGLNPREALARTAVERLDTDDPREWRLAAEEIGLR